MNITINVGMFSSESLASYCGKHLSNILNVALTLMITLLIQKYNVKIAQRGERGEIEFRFGSNKV